MYWISTLGNRRTSHVFIGFSMLMLAACGGGGGGGGGGNGSASSSKASTNVSWTKPTTRTDGNALYPAEIAEIVVYFGPSRQELTRQAQIDDSGVTSYDVENLSPGQYYFAVSAVDTSGLEGPKSKIIPVTVD